MSKILGMGAIIEQQDQKWVNFIQSDDFIYLLNCFLHYYKYM